MIFERPHVHNNGLSLCISTINQQLLVRVHKVEFVKYFSGAQGVQQLLHNGQRVGTLLEAFIESAFIIYADVHWPVRFYWRYDQSLPFCMVDWFQDLLADKLIQFPVYFLLEGKGNPMDLHLNWRYLRV